MNGNTLHHISYITSIVILHIRNITIVIKRIILRIFSHINVIINIVLTIDNAIYSHSIFLQHGCNVKIFKRNNYLMICNITIGNKMTLSDQC